MRKPARNLFLAALLAPTFLFLVSALAPEHLSLRRWIAELLAVLAGSGPVPDSRARPTPTQTN